MRARLSGTDLDVISCTALLRTLGKAQSLRRRVVGPAARLYVYCIDSCGEILQVAPPKWTGGVPLSRYNTNSSPEPHGSVRRHRNFPRWGARRPADGRETDGDGVLARRELSAVTVEQAVCCAVGGGPN